MCISFDLVSKFNNGLMKKLPYILIVVFLFAATLHSKGQGTITGTGTVTYNSDGSTTVAGGERIFTTLYTTGSGYKEEDFIRFNPDFLFQVVSPYGVPQYQFPDIPTYVENGIKGSVKSDKAGYIRVEVFGLPNTTGSVYGPLIYKSEINASSSLYTSNPMQLPNPVGSGSVSSTDIKVNSQQLLKKTVLCAQDNWFKRFLTSVSNLYFGAPQSGMYNVGVNSTPCTSATSVPVIIRVTIKEATVQGISIPGVKTFQNGKFSVNGYFNNTGNNVEVYVNGISKGVFPFSQPNPANIIDMKLGDLITFKVSNPHGETPVIEGVPATWISRCAGDLQYYCTPSVKPGEFNPFIGFDSRVHFFALKNYPTDFQVKMPDWVYNAADKTYKWSITASREMDASKLPGQNLFDNKRFNPYEWEKYHIVNGAAQRHNQKEGQNVRLLAYWNDFNNGGSWKNYNGAIKYFFCVDEDELVYLNSKYHDAATPGHEPSPGGAILRYATDYWKEMPEGNALIYDDNGYPKSGFPVNLMVTAYQRNRDAVLNTAPRLNDKYYYNGYEIEDIGTDIAHPFGTGAGNNKAPGQVTVSCGGRSVRLKFNVTSPLNYETGKAGFYGSISGDAAPPKLAKNVPYTLSGLKDKTDEELKKFSMRVTAENWEGRIESSTDKIFKIPESEYQQVRQTGKWTLRIPELPYAAYLSVTAYYKQPLADSVIIAGKRINVVGLRFLGIDEKIPGSLDIGEGKGLAFWSFLEDHRSVPHDDMVRQQYNKTYVFKPGSTVTFTTWDEDPFMFEFDDVNEKEYYLSSESQAMKIKNSVLLDRLEYYVTPVADPAVDFKTLNWGNKITAGRSGKRFTYTFSTPGTYGVKVRYGYGSRTDKGTDMGEATEICVLVKVVDYGTAADIQNNNASAEIKGALLATRSLTQDESRWMFLTSQESLDYMVVEVSNIQSTYKFKDGPRANAKPNRWAKDNDYAEEYRWYSSPTSYYEYHEDSRFSEYLITYPYKIRGEGSTNQPDEWMWKNWVLHYSSNWSRDPAMNYIPSYVKPSQVVSVNLGNVRQVVEKYQSYISQEFFGNNDDPYQKLLPLVSFTDYKGYRFRSNPKPVVNVPRFFRSFDGVFSGAPPANPVIVAPDITDDQKDEQEFYYKLKNKQILIVNRNQAGTRVWVYNTKDAASPSGRLIATGVLAAPPQTASKSSLPCAADTINNAVTVKTSPDDLSLKNKLISFRLYPNPAENNKVMVEFDNPVNGKVYVELKDAAGGRTVYSRFFVLKGETKIALDLPATVAAGSYFLRVASEEGSKETVLIIPK